MALGQFSPGPDLLLVTRTALADGAGAGFRMALGIGTGLAAHATLAIGGTALLFQSAGWVRVTMGVLAAGYLLWLSQGLLRAWFHHFRSGPTEGRPARGDRRAPYLRGLFCNLLNPKVLMFLAAVTAPFLAGERPGWWPAAIWAIVVGQGWLLWSLWAVVLQWRPIRAGYHRAGPWIDGAFGIVLALLAVVLLFGELT
jgi:threonine/homoserine/homoserine lactone efflux protein